MINNRWIFMLLLPVAVLFASCDDDESYSDMKKRESRAINSFINENGISVISLTTFLAQDSVTKVGNNDNEYVLIDNVYMQIVKNPKGTSGAKKITDGTSLNLLVKYTEYSILDADTLTSNRNEAEPDEMTVRNDSGTYEASFSSGVMYDSYGTTAVPNGWLVVMPYLYFTRSQSKLAEVNLIVPHTEGTSTAASYVYPCFYNIKFQPEQ